LRQLKRKQTRLSPITVKAIDHYVTAEIAWQRIPGTEIGIYRNGKALFEKGDGMANAHHDDYGFCRSELEYTSPLIIHKA
jgi:hypothetical protein